MPEAEGRRLACEYQKASVILEYGSGGSTIAASSYAQKRVFSVESDLFWALRLRSRIDELKLPSPATVYHADIGPTGDWGRPLDATHWDRFWRYPAQIWDEPFFRHPDVVLIDGRFRAACFATVLLRIKRPTIILFDDYVGRHSYHDVEYYLSPTETIGRMAVFEARPGLINADRSTVMFNLFFRATYPRQADYDRRSEPGSRKERP
jgi:hypothetical protein